jgi:hypothetical protein
MGESFTPGERYGANGTTSARAARPSRFPPREKSKARHTEGARGCSRFRSGSELCGFKFEAQPILGCSKSLLRNVAPDWRTNRVMKRLPMPRMKYPRGPAQENGTNRLLNSIPAACLTWSRVSRTIVGHGTAGPDPNVETRRHVGGSGRVCTRDHPTLHCDRSAAERDRALSLVGSSWGGPVHD